MRMPIPVPSRLFTAWATTPGPIGPVATEQLGLITPTITAVTAARLGPWTAANTMALPRSPAIFP
jgi:hypothetical protein